MIKRIIYITIFILIYNFSFSQAFQKGNFNIYTGVGTGIYGITSNDTAETANSGVGALKFLYPITANYYITDKFAIGVTMQYNRIYSNPDSTKIFSRTINTGVNCQLVLMNNPDDNVYINFGFGNSYLSWRTTTKTSGVKGYGYFYNLGFGIQHYFNNNWGMY